MRIVYGAEEGRRSLLRRFPLAHEDLPAFVREDVRRVFGADLSAEAVVDRILQDVREEGDAAVLRYNEDVDGVHGDLLSTSLEVKREETEAAYEQVEPALVDALREAAERIRRFHERQLEHSAKSFREDGIGQVVRPLRRAGVYVPGTKAVYPSTVLMTAVPARVAGVTEVIMVTPALEDATISPIKLVAADIAGVSRVFRAGGVQGIAALAYGTETIPAVDKICGPGNIFVTLAKKRLFGEVGIDGLFGPSETLIVADSEADASLLAADLLAGAEHDELATVVLITLSRSQAQAVAQEVEAQIETMGRSVVARASLESRGGIVVVDTLDEAMALSNEFAPEHLCLHVEDAERLLPEVVNAGCVFLGAASAESLGDYNVGPSHVLPTARSAVFSSGLGVQDFLKMTTVIALDGKTAARVAPPAAAIARAEGLTGHARAIDRRGGK